MKKIILLAAMGSEVAPLEKKLPGIVILGTGVGKVAAAMNTQRAILEHRPDAIVFVGVAGGLGGVARLDVVVAKDVVFASPAKPSFTPPPPPILTFLYLSLPFLTFPYICTSHP